MDVIIASLPAFQRNRTADLLIKRYRENVPFIQLVGKGGIFLLVDPKASVQEKFHLEHRYREHFPVFDDFGEGGFLPLPGRVGLKMDFHMEIPAPEPPVAPFQKEKQKEKQT